MPSKKGKAKQTVVSPAATTQMYEVVPGPGYKIQAHLSPVKERRKHKTYSAAFLDMTMGRVGHSAFLSPDQTTICVVGGNPVPSDQVELEVWDFSTSSEDSLLETAPNVAPEEVTQTILLQQPPVKAKPAQQTTLSKLKNSPPTKSTPAKAGATPSLPVTGPSRSPPPSGKSISASPPETGRSHGKEEAAVPVQAEAAAPEVAPPSRSPAPTAFDNFKTRFPLMECFRISSHAWFIPPGERKRAAACEGVILWPTQAGALVTWINSTPLPSGVAAAELLSQVKGAQGPSGSPPSNTSGRGTKRLGSPEPGKSGYNISPANRSMGKDDPVMQGCPLLPPPQRAKWDGPDGAAFIGGWDGRRRLSAVLEYNLACSITDATGAQRDIKSQDIDTYELLLDSIPQVVDLPIPASSNATATLVKDKCYVFGGNSLNGTSDDLYVLECSRFREAEFFQGEVTSSSANVGRSKHLHHSGQSVWECHPVSGAAYTAMLASQPVCSSPLRDSELSRVSEQDVSTNFSAPPSRASPSQMTLNASAMGTLTSGPANVAPVVPVVNHLPGPPARSSHSAVAFQSRFIIYFGGRQLVLPHAEPQGRGRSKSVKPPARKGSAKEKEKGGKGAKGAPQPVDEDEESLPSLKLLNDLAVYDTELKGWVQVRVVGNDTPPARYAAAMCAVPPPVTGSTSNAHVFESVQEVSVASLSFQQALRRDAGGNSSGTASIPREVVLHGGFGEHDVILNDMWVLQAIGKGQNGSVVEADATTGVPSMSFRWIRIIPETRPDSASNSGSAGASPGIVTSRNSSPALPAVDNLGAAMVTSSVELAAQEYPSRAQHTITVTSNREVFIIGGVQPYTQQHYYTLAHSPQPSDARLHQCVTSNKTDMVKVSLPLLDGVVEVPLHRKASMHKKK